MDRYDAIVVGAGHAGVEASLVLERQGLKVLLATNKPFPNLFYEL